ncbi:MFS transporter [Streptomyces sp. B6B3]|uniref:MFS transporter n=1 Tax=Streptomyces sp. B6B3 TaxID=3153570 RepID=UPI00325DF205
MNAIDSTAPAQTGPRTAQDRRMAMRALAGVSAGNFVEWYDFAIYAYSSTVIADLFFPSGNDTVALLGTLAVFGLTFVTRPLGGVFFGRLGDRIGRRNTLVAILTLMGVSTTLIGLLPTYDTVGIAAPILLTLLRLCQGFSGGGESSGGATFLSEYAPSNRRGTWSGLSNSTQTLPFAVAALLILVLNTWLGDADYEGWGWRIPFLISAPFALVGLFLRMRIDDTPVFRSLENSKRVAHAPLREVLSGYRRELLVLIGIASLNAVAFYTVSSYFTTYLQEVVDLSATTALASNSLALLAYSLFIPLAGMVGDRVGRKRVIRAGALALAALAVPGYLIAGSGGFGLAVVGQLLITLPLVTVASVVAVAQAELFPAAVRYTGAALGYNIAYAVFGGSAPFLGQYLVLVTDNKLAPAFYLIALALLALIPIRALPETSSLSMLRADNAMLTPKAH